MNLLRLKFFRLLSSVLKEKYVILCCCCIDLCLKEAAIPDIPYLCPGIVDSVLDIFYIVFYIS